MTGGRTRGENNKNVQSVLNALIILFLLLPLRFYFCNQMKNYKFSTKQKIQTAIRMKCRPSSLYSHRCVRRHLTRWAVVGHAPRLSGTHEERPSYCGRGRKTIYRDTSCFQLLLLQPRDVLIGSLNSITGLSGLRLQ